MGGGRGIHAHPNINYICLVANNYKYSCLSKDNYICVFFGDGVVGGNFIRGFPSGVLLERNYICGFLGGGLVGGKLIRGFPGGVVGEGNYSVVEGRLIYLWYLSGVCNHVIAPGHVGTLTVEGFAGAAEKSWSILVCL